MSREITKEEEAVIEAALDDSSGHHDAVPYEECGLCKTLDALRAARAPKEPMTAHDRARDIYAQYVGPYGDRTVRVAEDHIREAESAAWDRCVEAAFIAAREANDLFDFSVDSAIRSLYGKCHEDGPCVSPTDRRV